MTQLHRLHFFDIRWNIIRILVSLSWYCPSPVDLATVICLFCRLIISFDTIRIHNPSRLSKNTFLFFPSRVKLYLLCHDNHHLRVKGAFYHSLENTVFFRSHSCNLSPTRCSVEVIRIMLILTWSCPIDQYSKFCDVTIRYHVSQRKCHTLNMINLVSWNWW